MGDYGVALRRARDRAGLSQRALGDKVGVERAHIARIESGSIKMPSASLRGRLALALGGDPLEMVPDPESGARVALVQAVKGLTEREAEMVLEMIGVLVKYGRGVSASDGTVQRPG